MICFWTRVRSQSCGEWPPPPSPTPMPLTSNSMFKSKPALPEEDLDLIVPASEEIGWAWLGSGWPLAEAAGTVAELPRTPDWLRRRHCHRHRCHYHHHYYHLHHSVAAVGIAAVAPVGRLVVALMAAAHLVVALVPMACQGFPEIRNKNINEAHIL